MPRAQLVHDGVGHGHGVKRERLCSVPATGWVAPDFVDGIVLNNVF